MSTDSSDGADGSPAPDAPLTALHWIGIALATATGGIHLWLGVTASKPPLAVAGVGFGVGVAAVLLGVRRQTVVGLGVPFVAVQVALYLVGHGVVGPQEVAVTSTGIADKAVQSALVVVLVVLWRRSEAEAGPGARDRPE